MVFDKDHQFVRKFRTKFKKSEQNMLRYLLLTLLVISCASTNNSENPKIQKTLEDNMSLLEFCISKYHPNSLPPVDKIDITFIIQKDGKVQNARVDHLGGNTAEDYLESSRNFEVSITPATEKCIVETLQRLRFAPLKEMGISESKIQIMKSLQFNNPK